MPKAKNTVYISNLTPLRGLAALWVILFHIDVSIYYRELGALISRENTGFFSKGYLWVDFFFLLSGFIMAHVYGNYLAEGVTLKSSKSFLWARFSRIYPLHLFTTLTLVLGVIIAPYFAPSIVDGSFDAFFNWEMLPNHFLLTNAMTQYHALTWNIPAWSIGAEWWAYMVSIGLFPLIFHRKQWLIYLSAILCFGLLAVLVYWHPSKSLDITWDFGWARCLCEFVIGISLYILYKNKTGISLLSKDAVAVVLLFCIGLFFHFQLPDLCTLPIFALLILAASYNQSKVQHWLQKPIFQYLGNISYALYMVHGLWFMLFWFAFPTLKKAYTIEVLAVYWRVIYVLVFLFLTIISAHFVHIYIELKCRKALRQSKGT